MRVHGKITARDGATITVVLACNDPLMGIPEPGMEITGTAERPQVTVPRAVLEAIVAGDVSAETLATVKTALARPGQDGITRADLVRSLGYSFLPDVPDPDAALTPTDPAEAAPPEAPPKPKRTRDRA